MFLKFRTLSDYIFVFVNWIIMIISFKYRITESQSQKGYLENWENKYVYI